MAKPLLFVDDARAKVKKGIAIVSTAVATTLGPKERGGRALQL
jgi:chaperonin GroEL (HSP60 family)